MEEPKHLRYNKMSMVQTYLKVVSQKAQARKQYITGQ